jgi:hypothetical protein
MCALNTNELAWTKLKHYMRHHNTTGDLTMRRLQDPVTAEHCAVTPADRFGFPQHIIDL